MINVLKQQGKCWRYGPWILNWTEKCRQQTKTKMKGRVSDWTASRFKYTVTGSHLQHCKTETNIPTMGPLKTSETVIKNSNTI